LWRRLIREQWQLLLHSRQETSIIVDTGLSCRETEEATKTHRPVAENVKDIFITHERRRSTYMGFPPSLKIQDTGLRFAGNAAPKADGYRKIFGARNSIARAITVGDLQVTSFLKSHDARDPHSFIVSRNGVKVGVFTDLGMPCENVVHYFSQCHAAFLESNYDEDLLDKEVTLIT